MDSDHCRASPDLLVRSLIDAFMVAQLLERHRFRARCGETLSRVLLAFAERMASLGVRLSSRDYLVSGLLALAAEGWNREPREDLSILSLLHDAAIRIGVDPREAFQEVLPYATKSVANSLQRFLQRKEEDKSIEAMGYRAAEDSDGFRYKRTW